MALNDPLANTLSKLQNAELRCKTTCIVRPMSKVIAKVLTIMQEHGYIGQFEKTEDGRGDFATVFLIGKLNKCGAIKPRYAVKKSNFEKFEQRYLPAKNFGLLIVSSPAGITTQNEAKKQNTGGRLLAYCY